MGNQKGYWLPLGALRLLHLVMNQMNQMNQIKEIQNLKFYTGAHPKIRSQLKRNNRPTEFGNKIWETSLVLIDHLETEPFALSNLRVLEIGCGWGLVGVFLAKYFSCEVTCSDMDHRVLPIAQLHAELNQVEIHTQCVSFSDLSEESLRDFDLIIGAEVCYSDETSTEICNLFQKAKNAGVSHLVIGDPGRPGFDDCIDFSQKNFKTNLIELPGTTNGKATLVLTTHL